MPVPDRRAFCELAKVGNLVPVYEELIADTETPVSVLSKLGPESEVFLLESVTGGERIGRYSFIGHSPFLRFTSRGPRVWIERDGCSEQMALAANQSPLSVLRDTLGEYSPVRLEGLPRFTGGIVGYIGYDTVRFFERLPAPPPDDLGMPDCLLVGVDQLIIFDHVTHTMKVLVNARVDGDPGASYDQATRRIDAVIERLRSEPARSGIVAVAFRRPAVAERLALPEGVSCNFSRDGFMRAVEAAKGYIAAGDIIQVVLSQRFSRRVAASPFEVYRALRVVNPSPYMYYLALGGRYVVGSSPEILVTHDEGQVRVRPIAGTRPRGRTSAEDAVLERALLADEKERAEHVMLVDLGRNDLGRVCAYGSVTVDELMVVERYSHVMHIVSDITGTLAPGRDQFDVLEAAFPAGTVSGAPKVRAMEIINELEPTRRGPYAGAVGYFGFYGNMDACITIRTILLDHGLAHVQAGAGIVADSVPEREYQETINKAAALFAAIEMAGAGAR